jgi:hypothetical protein
MCFPLRILALCVIVCSCKQTSTTKTTGSPLVISASVDDAKATVESVCDTFCSEHRIHDVALSNAKAGGFDVTGSVRSGETKAFTAALVQELKAIGWNPGWYQMHFNDPDRFTLNVHPIDP